MQKTQSQSDTETKSLNDWKVSCDDVTTYVCRDPSKHMVLKREFSQEGSLSLMVSNHGPGKENYQVELAVEKEKSVIGVLRLDNTATEKEAINQVLDITEAI